MAQIAVTLEKVEQREQRRNLYNPAISTSIGIGENYTLLPSSAGGTVILDTITNTEYTVSESTVIISARISAANSGIILADSPNIDAFARLRVSNPETLFDSKNIFNDPDLATSVENQPLFYDNQETSGGGTSTTYNPNEASQTMGVSVTTAGVRCRRTKMRFNYQPGKSQLVLMTFNFEGVGGSGITKREGIFDDNDGIFLEAKDGAMGVVLRSSATGSPVPTREEQADWNLDTMDGLGASGVTLDFTKTQILLIDYEWLGVGRVRVGFVIDGIPVYCHEFLNSNVNDVAYMQTPNLPLTSEIENDGTGAADTITQICSTVISEGGSQDLGIVRSANTAGTHIDANAENTFYAVIGVKLKANYLGAAIKILKIALQEQAGSKKLLWSLRLNPVVESTFTYADKPQSALQVATGALANTVTGGYEIDSGFFESGGAPVGSAGSAGEGVDSAIRLGSLIDGTPDEIVLCVAPVGGTTNADVEGSITWRELT